MQDVTVIDVVLLGILAALWAVILWRGVRSRVLAELWWSCVAITVIITFKIGVIAHPFNTATGGIFLDVLLTEVAAVGAMMLTLQWQSMVRHGSRQPGRLARRLTILGVTAFLLVTWFIAPIYDMPSGISWFPADVFNSVPMAVHWFVFHAFLAVSAGIFARHTWAEARVLPGGYIRTSLYLLVASATILVVHAGIHVVLHFLVLVAGIPFPPDFYMPLNIGLTFVFVLFLVAVAIPLARRGRWRQNTGQADTAVVSLWTWIRDVADSDDTGAVQIDTDSGKTLLDQVVEIRDRMWILQQWVAPADVAAAFRQAKLGGMFGAQARAFVVASYLRGAAEAVRRGAPRVTPPPGDIVGLGGGRRLRAEAQWFAIVWSSLRANRASALPDRT